MHLRWREIYDDICTLVDTHFTRTSVAIEELFLLLENAAKPVTFRLCRRAV